MTRWLAFLIISVIIPNLQAQHPKIAPDLRGVAAATVDVIVQFTSPPTSAQHERVKQKGGSFISDLGVSQAALYSIPSDNLRSLAEDPEVIYISPDRPVMKLLDVTAPSVNAGIA